MLGAKGGSQQTLGHARCSTAWWQSQLEAPCRFRGTFDVKPKVSHPQGGVGEEAEPPELRPARGVALGKGMI